jgi:nitroreductase/dihydropteridine reductase
MGYKATMIYLCKMNTEFSDGLECRGNVKQNTFLNNLEWRRAVKHFGDTPIDTSAVLKAIINAPSSFGLQPYRIIAVRNSDLKKQLQAVCYNQSQVSECDTLFVFCARRDLERRSEEYIRAIQADAVLIDMIKTFITNLSDKVGWAIRQTYIALGFALAACAELKIASCPMEGFDASSVHSILGLSENLIPCVLLATGSQTENDGTWPRFRFPETNLIEDRN